MPKAQSFRVWKYEILLLHYARIGEYSHYYIHQKPSAMYVPKMRLRLGLWWVWWFTTMIGIKLKRWPVRPCPDICRHANCHPNPCTRFWLILLTDRRTNIAGNRITSSVVGGNETRALMQRAETPPRPLHCRLVVTEYKYHKKILYRTNCRIW